MQVVEAFLYILFLADCFTLIAFQGAQPDYFPPGGISLIVILLLIGLVQWVRAGGDPY